MPDIWPADPAYSPDDSTDGGPAVYADLDFNQSPRESRWAELLAALADEYGCDFEQISPGRYMMRPGSSAPDLNR